MEILGLTVKSDRQLLGLTQRELDAIANNNALKFKVYGVGYGWCGQIERCVKRSVSVAERELLAFCLEQPKDRYLNLSTDPRKLIGILLARESKESNDSVLRRSIVFPPEYKQAGVAILSYFSEVVAKKYPGEDVQVSILQKGNSVTLHVETRDGKIEKIEKTLEQYGLVVTGKMALEKFTDDRELIRDLKTRLEVTGLELRLRQEAYLEQKTGYEKRIGSLEEQVQNLFALVSTGLRHAHSLSEVIKNLSSTAKINARVVSSLEKICTLAMEAYSKQREEEMIQAFKEVKNESPSFYQHLRSTLASIPGGIMGNLATPWVQALINSLPR